MSDIETCEQAFPTPGLSSLPNGDFIYPMTGMTLRQYYAAKALQGLLSGQWPDEKESKEIARRAFVLADLMVEAGK